METQNLWKNIFNFIDDDTKFQQGQENLIFFRIFDIENLEKIISFLKLA